jgi:hypothetical protein
MSCPGRPSEAPAARARRSLPASFGPRKTAPPPARKAAAFLFGARYRPEAAVKAFERAVRRKDLGELTFEDFELLAELRETL